MNSMPTTTTNPGACDSLENQPTLRLAVAEPLADLTLALASQASGSIPAMMAKLHAGLRANPDCALLLTDEQIGTVSQAYRTASGIALAAVASKAKAPSMSAAQKNMIASGDF